MLSLLHIENIALIDSADISFGEGLNVLTGETGAGKSIVLDAISALMGERTSRDLIRTGEKAALVSGLFSNIPALPWFEETGIGPDENGELLVSRQILGDGKNLCRVGGQPCTVVQLRALGRQLINIHGQHDGQQLLDERSHLAYLDSFGGLAPQLEEYRQAFQALHELSQEMNALTMDEAEKSRRIDTLEYQIKELEQAQLLPGEEEDLSRRRSMLRNSGKLMDAVERAYLALMGDEELPGAVALLGDAEGAISGISGLDATMEQCEQELAELSVQADEIARQIRDMRDNFEFSPHELDQIESRLDVLYRLKKKYGSSEEEMLSYLEKCQEELDSIQMSADRLLRLEKKYEAALVLATEKAQILSAARRVAGDELQRRIEQELGQLDMPKVQFYIECKPRESAMPLDQTGMDDVQFLMSANLGESVKPIQKVASGGELSRIMLALKNVLTENDLVSTLIFDEVDAGVSGRAAQKVAEKMGNLARKRQILCVTHLPQIAAMADLHFSVEKGEQQGRTFTIVTPLDQEERVQELARLTGGSHISEVIQKGALELLQQAQGLKEKWS